MNESSLEKNNVAPPSPVAIKQRGKTPLQARGESRIARQLIAEGNRGFEVIG